jgi:type 1 glutamine amidotransferase
MTPRVDRSGRVAGVAACLVLLAISEAASAGEAAAGRSPAAVRVLILSAGGQPDGCGSAASLRRILAGTGRFEVRVSELPAGLTARALADFDLLVDDYAGPPLGRDTEAAVAGFVESGKGLVVTHRPLAHAASRPGDNDERKNVPAYWPLRPKDKPLEPVRFIDVKAVRPEQPIVRGMKSRFRTADAAPGGLGVLPSAEVILAAVVDGRKEPVLAVSGLGKGRVVGMALGHDAAAMHEKAFVAAFARACEWAATGVVTLPPGLEPAHPGAGTVKALLITGGHDHDAEFYTIFDGYKELDALPVLTSAAAFKADIRGEYDVVIMYDFSRDLDDAGKKHLREFVESGGGVVVLHHALLNYQDWTWWDDEVVGGSYRLTKPSSRVKNDQQIDATPVAGHPVTAGIAPFHIQDEAYKNLRMSPKVRPLLTTDNPTSDTNLAWLGPQERYRVVAIQLGHGRTAFAHPSYRSLVHNAVLWAAGNLK